MNNASKPVRPVKREVIKIEDEESIRMQPIVKSVKREEEEAPEPFGPVPPPELFAPQQTLTTSDMHCQGGCRAAEEAVLRAESAEKLIERWGVIASKEKVEELEEKLAEVTARCEKTRRRAENVFASKVELKHENDTLKAELAKQKISATQITNELQLKVNNLIIQLEEERLRASDNQTRDQARIDLLTNRLARYECGPHPVDIDHPTNLFQLRIPDSNESMSYDIAHQKLISVVTELEGDSIDNKLNRHFVKLPKLYSLVLLCRPCGAMLNNTGIIQHFLSNEHQQMLSARNAAVSRVAFNFWTGKLQPETGGHQKQQQRMAAGSDRCAAAAAATPKARGEKNGIKKEETCITLSDD